MNFCRRCNQDFSSVVTFERHQIGDRNHDHSPATPGGFRCLEPHEMIELGWFINARGRWQNPRQAFGGV
jgi:hypothetical protein